MLSYDDDLIFQVYRRIASGFREVQIVKLNTGSSVGGHHALMAALHAFNHFCLASQVCPVSCSFSLSQKTSQEGFMKPHGRPEGHGKRFHGQCLLMKEAVTLTWMTKLRPQRCSDLYILETLEDAQSLYTDFGKVFLFLRLIHQGKKILLVDNSLQVNSENCEVPWMDLRRKMLFLKRHPDALGWSH